MVFAALCLDPPAANNNSSMVTLGVEGATNAGKDLYVINNAFVNDDSSRATFLSIGSGHHAGAGAEQPVRGRGHTVHPE